MAKADPEENGGDSKTAQLGKGTRDDLTRYSLFMLPILTAFAMFVIVYPPAPLAIKCMAAGALWRGAKRLSDAFIEKHTRVAGEWHFRLGRVLIVARGNKSFPISK